MAAKDEENAPLEGEECADQRAVLRGRGSFREEGQARPEDNRDADEADRRRRPAIDKTTTSARMIAESATTMSGAA